MKVYMLLDGSGSMDTSWDEMLGAINGYVRGLDKDVEVSLSVFDSYSQMNYNTIRNTTVDKWKKLSRDDVHPAGGTPLLDAMGRTLWRVIDDNHERAIFVLITDGEENSSLKFNKSEIHNLISQVKAKDYPVLFFGANFDKIGDIAKQYGVSKDYYMNMRTANFSGTLTASAESAMNYMNTGAVNVTMLSNVAVTTPPFENFKSNERS